MFFEINNVLEEKKVPTILTLMGNKMYALLRSISKKAERVVVCGNCG